MWLYVPRSTSSASAPVAEASTSASDWRCQMLTRSCWWRGKPSRSPIWSQRLKRVAWLRRLSGAMCEPSTAAHGVALWMDSLAASRVRHTASPERSAEALTNATCGLPPGASSSSAAPGSSSSKTSRACSRRGMTKSLAPSGSSETFASLVSRLRLDYSARQKSAQRISATGFSSLQWRTPTDDSRRGGAQSGAKRLDGGHTMNLQDQVQDFPSNWPTPCAAEPEQGPNHQRHRMTRAERGGGAALNLGTMAATWPTPTTRDHRSTEASQASHDRNARPLSEFVGLWMTPRVSETGQYQYSKGDKDNPVPTLQGQAQSWATPSVADTTGGRMTRSGDRSNEQLLKGQAETVSLASSLPDHPISTVGEESSKIRRTLSPLFVEWLMGWPPGWTSLARTPPASNGCACSATALFLYRQRMHSALLSLGSPPPAPPVQFTLFG